MDTLIGIGILVILLLYWNLKETIRNGEEAHDQHNAWQKERGREMNKNGVYEDREVIEERVRKNNAQS